MKIDVITRNFIRLMRAGALNEFEALEPMSPFKWRRLQQMIQAQNVEEVAQKALANSLYQEEAASLAAWLQEPAKPWKGNEHPQLSFRLLNHRLQRIVNNERHAIDTNMAAVDVLRIIAGGVNDMLCRGTLLSAAVCLGSYLRERGDQVDFVKLDKWLGDLWLRRIAQLEGSVLVEVFNFEQDEIPFVNHIEPAAYRLVIRSLVHTASDTAEEWHFRQTRAGFVENNSAAMRRNLRRCLRFFPYAPIETLSRLVSSFALSLQEIEE